MTKQLSPLNTNYLALNGFNFLIKKLPTVEFFLQEINIPSLTISPVDTPNPLVNLPYSGDHVNYEILTLSYKVDEDMLNYMEIHNWMRGLGFPHDHGEYAAIQNVNQFSGEGLTSDCTLMILDSKKRPNIQMTFYNAFPVFLRGHEPHHHPRDDKLRDSDRLIQI